MLLNKRSCFVKLDLNSAFVLVVHIKAKTELEKKYKN